MTKAVKTFTSIDEQLELLTSRGLSLDEKLANQWLRNVGYYRLSGYWYPYREFSEGRRQDSFTANSSFAEVTRLYEFDRKLRTLIHDGIERVEVTLRSHLSYRLGANGPIAYQDATVFRPKFDHSAWTNTVETRVSRAKRHSEPIRHHMQKYNGTLPIWVLTEVLDFSDISRLYDGLRAKDQWLIAEQLGFQIDLNSVGSNQRSKAKKAHPLARWLEQLSVLRNTCAHHSRVWNRSFAPVSTTAMRTIKELQSLPSGQSEQLYGALLVIGLVLQQASPGSTWMQKTRALVEESFADLPAREVTEMGFPEDWQNELLWTSSV